MKRVVPIAVGFFLSTVLGTLAPASAEEAIALISSLAGTHSIKLVQLETRPGVNEKFILIKRANPAASVILFAGGQGLLKLESSFGKLRIQGNKTNFVVRTREYFADHGFMVALVDAPSDRRSEGMDDFFRMSNEHAQDIKAVASYLKDEARAPVWLVGTSKGTVSASNGGIQIKEGIDGLVLTSTITKNRKTDKIWESHPKGILNMALDKITVPILIVSHREDKCGLTPASDTPKIKKALVNSPRVEVMYFKGGKKPKSKPCLPLSAHGFYGIEKQVVSAIAEFIKSKPK